MKTRNNQGISPPSDNGIGNFIIGIVLGILLIIFLLELLIFSAYYQPQNFGQTYKEFFCNNLKTQ